MNGREKLSCSPEPNAGAMAPAAVKHGDTVYISGIAGIDDEGLVCSHVGMESQIRQAYRNLECVLGGFGATLDDVVSETIYVTDIERALATGVIQRAYSPLAGPARTVLEVRRLFLPSLMFQIACIARI
jgi:2-iminobutanoate/2-iminopropanoate deaminase